MGNIDVGDTPITFARVKSGRFLCGRCLAFCVEIIPIIKRGMGPVFYAKLREERNKAIMLRRPYNNPLKMKLECPSGCHRSPAWTFNDLSTPKGRGFKPKADKK
jgi:hypothetical protein